MAIDNVMPQKRKQVKIFDRQKIPELIEFLSEKLYDFQNNTDANDACDQLIKAYEDGITHFSKTYKPSRRKTPMKPWITPGLLCSINMKNKLYKKVLKNMNISNERKYKQYRNVLVNIIREAKKLYIQKSLEDNKNDGKQTWKVLNNLMNKRKNKQTMYPNVFYDNGEHSFKDEEVVEGFNAFFASIGAELEGNIPAARKCPLEYIEGLLDQSIETIQRISSGQISNIIRYLNPVGNQGSGNRWYQYLYIAKDI